MREAPSAAWAMNTYSRWQATPKENAEWQACWRAAFQRRKSNRPKSKWESPYSRQHGTWFRFDNRMNANKWFVVNRWNTDALSQRITTVRGSSRFCCNSQVWCYFEQQQGETVEDDWGWMEERPFSLADGLWAKLGSACCHWFSCRFGMVWAMALINFQVNANKK